MEKNMGAFDRFFRLVVGLILALLVIVKSVTGVAAVILGILGIVLILTSLIGFCPLYATIKFSTLKEK